MTDEQNDTPEVLRRKLDRANSDWARMNDQLAAAQVELDGLRKLVASLKREAEDAAKLHEWRRTALEDAISSAMYWQERAAKPGWVEELTSQRDAARRAAERAHRARAWTALAWVVACSAQIAIQVVL